MTATSPINLPEMEDDCSSDNNSEAVPQSDDDSNDSIIDDDFDGLSDGNMGGESGSDSDNGEDSSKGNTGWADSMSKILKTKKPKNKKSLVLSKAKLMGDKKDVKEEKIGFEIIDEEKKDESVSIKAEDDDEPQIKKRRENHPDLRVKPDILERERERLLSKIATRGVVQLFNTVRNQQKDINKKMDEAGPLERKKDKVIKSLDKTKFLDILMGESKSENVNKTLANTKKKEPIKKEDSSTWNVFREDFMMGAKMRDWDKKEPEEENDDEEVESESDSD